MRGEGCVVTIKPLENREALLKQAQEALSAFDNRYEARISGHTSIDVTVKDYDKKTMLREIMKKHGLKAEDVIYVGNETEMWRFKWRWENEYGFKMDKGAENL